MREILIVSGEASGDLHAARLAEELRGRCGGVALSGVGGAAMERSGVLLLDRSDRLAVMGFAEILSQVPQHLRLLRSLGARLRSGRIALVILINYPGFNMRVARLARAAGVPVLYYITPQVWAWGARRLPRLARLITKAATILPFEAALLRAAGIDATFVGHPLLDGAHEFPRREAARSELGLPSDARVLALFPGSRRQEIERHLDLFVETARRVQAAHPGGGLWVLVGGAPGIDIPPSRCPFQVVRGRSRVLFGAADAALCKSGTTTLEAAVAGCPLVVAYRTSRLTYALARRLVRIPHIGLVNVVAGREVAPEFVQEAAQSAALAAALLPLLDHAAPQRSRMIEELAAVRAQLGTPGAAQRVADIACGLLAR
ncbi:MAG: lipid-A-disaccharide synthase [Gemmatimonadaceae bacterium]